jgi:hypothetical protein
MSAVHSISILPAGMAIGRRPGLLRPRRLVVEVGI